MMLQKNSILLTKELFQEKQAWKVEIRNKEQAKSVAMANTCHLSDASLKLLQKMDESALLSFFSVLSPDICGFIELPTSIDEARTLLSGVSKLMCCWQVETVQGEYMLRDLAWFLVKCFKATCNSSSSLRFSTSLICIIKYIIWQSEKWVKH